MATPVYKSRVKGHERKTKAGKTRVRTHARKDAPKKGAKQKRAPRRWAKPYDGERQPWLLVTDIHSPDRDVAQSRPDVYFSDRLGELESVGEAYQLHWRYANIISEADEERGRRRFINDFGKPQMSLQLYRHKDDHKRLVWRGMRYATDMVCVEVRKRQGGWEVVQAYWKTEDGPAEERGRSMMAGVLRWLVKQYGELYSPTEVTSRESEAWHAATWDTRQGDGYWGIAATPDDDEVRIDKVMTGNQQVRYRLSTDAIEMPVSAAHKFKRYKDARRGKKAPEEEGQQALFSLANVLGLVNKGRTWVKASKRKLASGKTVNVKGFWKQVDDAEEDEAKQRRPATQGAMDLFAGGTDDEADTPQARTEAKPTRTRRVARPARTEPAPDKRDADAGGDGRKRSKGKKLVIARENLTPPASTEGIPRGLRKHLRDHQAFGVSAAIKSLDKHGGFVLADGTGAGKTRQILAVAKAYADRGHPVLIVAPSQVIKPNWAKRKFDPNSSYVEDGDAMGIDLEVYDNGESDHLEDGNIYMTTYHESKRPHPAELPKNTVVLFDESHYLKNAATSKRAEWGVEIAREAHSVLFATATLADKVEQLPYLERAGIYEGRTQDDQFQRLGLTKRTKTYTNKQTFKVTTKTWWEIGQDTDPQQVYQNISDLFGRITKKGMMLKRELSMDGVDVSFEGVKLPKEGEDALLDIEIGFSDGMEPPRGLMKAVMLMHQRRQQETYKIAAAVALAQKEIAEGRKVVLFCSRVNYSDAGKNLYDHKGDIVAREVYTESEGTAPLLKAALLDAGVPRNQIAELHGDRTPSEREVSQRTFRNGEKQVLIATVEAGGTGINLDDVKGDSPRTIVCVTAPFDAMGNVQMMGRIWRMNTQSDARVKYLFTHHAVDTWNASIVRKKFAALGATVAGELGKMEIGDPDTYSASDYVMPKLTAEDIARRQERIDKNAVREGKPKQAPLSTGTGAAAPAAVKGATPGTRRVKDKWDYITLKFPGSPGADITARMKGAGFRFYGPTKEWSAPLNTKRVAFVEEMSGATRAAWTKSIAGWMPGMVLVRKGEPNPFAKGKDDDDEGGEKATGDGGAQGKKSRGENSKDGEGKQGKVKAHPRKGTAGVNAHTAEETVHKGNVRAHRRKTGTVRAYPRRDQPRYTGKTVTPKGNVVYQYAPKDLAAAQTEKFVRILDLKGNLPAITKRVRAGLALGDTPREKVVAAVVALIDRLHFRIGTERMAEEHGTYGVTTLRPEHVTVEGNSIRFQFVGKKQVPWDRRTTDAKLAQFITSLQEGAEDEGQLFWYNEGNTKRPLQASDVNRFLGQWGVSAKDFRTYHATQMVFTELKRLSRPKGSRKLSKKEAKARVKQAVEVVAEQLGHTPAVCKSAYILPAVLADFEENGGRLSLPGWADAVTKAVAAMHAPLHITDDEREFGEYLDALARRLGIRNTRKSLVRLRKAAPKDKPTGEGAPKDKPTGEGAPKSDDTDEPDKAKKEKKTAPRFSSHEIKEMGLKWVTVHPHGKGSDGVPLLVKDTGDDYMVVGGAGGTMNFTRFSKQTTSAGQYGEGKGKADRDDVAAKTKERPEITPEMEAKGEQAKVAAKAAKERVTSRIMENVVGSGATDVSAKELAKIKDHVLTQAQKLGLADEATQKFLDNVLKQHTKQKKQAAEKATDEAVSQALQAKVDEELMGTKPVATEIALDQTDAEKAAGFDVSKVKLSDETLLDIAGLAAESAQATDELRSMRRALKDGDEKAVRALELSYQPLSDEQVAKYAIGQHIAKAELQATVDLVEATENPSRKMTTHIMHGAADAGAGLVADLVGATILDRATAKALGTVGAGHVIAKYLLEKGQNPKVVARSLREYIGTHSAANAAEAVAESQRQFELADEMAKFGKGEEKLTEAVSANARRLQFTNHASMVLGKALGTLETAAQVAWHLEHGAKGDVVIPGRQLEASTRAKAKELGLGPGTYKVHRSPDGWRITVNEDGLKQLYKEQSLEAYERDAELEEIKKNAYGDGWPEWSPDGIASDRVQLASHQKGNIKFWERQKRVLVADEAGSGKTATALAGIAHLHKQGKVKKALLVVPTSVVKGFQKEMEFFLADEYHDQYKSAATGSPKTRREAHQGDQLFTLITHNQLRNDHAIIKAAGYDAMVIDEAHYFSQRGTKAGKGSAMSKKARDVPVEYLMAMTGTPIKNDMTELHSLADWVNPGVLGTKTDFMEKYGNIAGQKGLFDASVQKTLADRLAGTMMGVKLTHAKVGKDGHHEVELTPSRPPNPFVTMREHTRFVGLSPEQRGAYKATEKAYLDSKGTDKAILPFTRDTEHGRTVNNINVEDHPKVLALQKDLANHPDEKAVIFATHGHSHETIIKGLGLKEGEYRLLTGTTKNRQEMADEINDPKSPVKYLIASDAANFGMNLQGASVLVNFDATMTYATHTQRIAREFRQKQQNNVTVYNYRTQTPLEIAAEQRIQRKKKIAGVPQALSSMDHSGVADIVERRLAELDAAAG